MKKELNFWNKLKIFLKWMKQHEDYGLMSACSICKSTRIKREANTEEILENKATYTALYRCMDCHSVAYAKEEWKKTTQ